MSRKRTCPECQAAVEGRVDKIFCGDYCKSAFHYRKKRGSDETLFRKIDRQVKLNRNLLLHFNRAGMATMRSEKLLESGFDPRYFTHYWKNGEGKVYLFCYEMGFLKIKKNGLDKYVLIHWQDYMTPGNKS